MAKVTASSQAASLARVETGVLASASSGMRAGSRNASTIAGSTKRSSPAAIRPPPPSDELSQERLAVEAASHTTAAAPTA